MCFKLTEIKVVTRTKLKTSPSGRSSAGSVAAVANATGKRAANHVRTGVPEVATGIVDADGTAGVAARKVEPRTGTMIAAKDVAIEILECIFP